MILRSTKKHDRRASQKKARRAQKVMGYTKESDRKRAMNRAENHARREESREAETLLMN